MKNSSFASKEQTVKKLQEQVAGLQSKMKGSKEALTSDDFIGWKIQKSEIRFERIRHPKENDIGHGTFDLLLDITAQKEAVYIPVSIASGKKPAGFVYQIEGTGEGLISTTDISCSDEGVTKVTWGTLLYAKIPAGKTATFRIHIEMNGTLAKTYMIVINRINYKLNPSDARYKRFDTEIRTKVLPFR